MTDPAYPRPAVLKMNDAPFDPGTTGLTKYEWLLGHILPAFLTCEPKETDWEERAWTKAIEYVGRITSE